jgi:hypothetical protein
MEDYSFRALSLSVELEGQIGGLIASKVLTPHFATINFTFLHFSV